jgi:hypothetical protein
MTMAQAQPQQQLRDSAFELAAAGPAGRQVRAAGRKCRLTIAVSKKEMESAVCISTALIFVLCNQLPLQAHHSAGHFDIDSPGLQQGSAAAREAQELHDPAGTGASMVQDHRLGGELGPSSGPPAPGAPAKGLHRTLRTPRKAGKENRGPAAGNGLLPVGHGASSQMTPKSTKMTEILSAHLTCPICCEWLLACHTLSCGHMFCGLCLATWLTQKQSCPSCRKPIAGEAGVSAMPQHCSLWAVSSTGAPHKGRVCNQV